jgi:outer membrane autotransporter protein
VADNGVFAIDYSVLFAFRFSGNITGSGALKTTGTAVELSGVNTYSGPTIILHGGLIAKSATAFSPNSQFDVAAGAVLDPNGYNCTIGSLTGSGLVTNGNPRTTSILSVGQDNSSTTFSGEILNNAGAVGLNKIGSGTLTLTGVVRATGGITISQGKLQLGNGGTTGSINWNVADNAVFAIDRSDTYTLRGTISGTGSLEQEGKGTTILNGDNTYSGGTTITAGTLVVNSASALGVGNVTVNGGVLTADPQPINVQGNYFQGPNGTLQLNVAGANPGQYDFINVTGNATLGGTLKLINQGFTPQAGETLRLVKTGGTIADKFANFVDPFTTRPGLNTIDLVYSLHTVDLEFLNIVASTPPPLRPLRITTINFSSFAQTPNELATGELLNAVELKPRFANLLDFFLAQPFSNISGDLSVIAPESLTAFYEISFSNANIQRLSLENRLDEVRANWGSVNSSGAGGGIVGLQKGSAKDGKSIKNPVEPVLLPAAAPRFDLWATGFGDFVKIDSDSNARGYRFTTGGFDLGFDFRFLDHFAVGVMGNYAHTWTDLRPGTITVNSGRGGLYGTYFDGGFYLNAGVYAGYNTYDSNRRALFGDAIGNTDGEEWSVFVSTGYDFHHGNLTVGPIASLQYTKVYISNFSETGSLLPMSIHSDSEESLRSDVGFGASYLWQLSRVALVPYLKATWEHEFKYSALPITAGLAGFPGPDETFTGPVEGQDSAVVSAGVSVQWTPAISSYFGYDGQLGRGRYSSNAVRGGVRVSW